MLKEIMLHKRIRRIFERKQLAIGIDKIQPDTRLADIGLDSLDLVDLLFEVENLFNVEIPDEHARKMTSITDIMTYVKNQQREQVGKGDKTVSPAKGQGRVQRVVLNCLGLRPRRGTPVANPRPQPSVGDAI